MRTFLAIPCPETVSVQLEEPRDHLNTEVDFRPVDTSNFHLTVKFLGDLTGSEINFLDRRLQSQLPTPGPLDLSVENVGVFPDVNSPSVAWAGVEAPDPLFNVHEKIENIVTEIDVDPDQHEFQPHITLGRFNNGSRFSNSVLNWIKNYSEKTFGTFTISTLHLFESELTPDGPEYSSIVRWPL